MVIAIKKIFASGTAFEIFECDRTRIREKLNGCENYESHAQKVCRLLRYSLTCMGICVRAVAQRGPDEAPERLHA